MHNETTKDTAKDHALIQDAVERMPIDDAPSADAAQEFFFPNDGGVTAFSCRADSLEEAQQRNKEHLERLQKETD